MFTTAGTLELDDAEAGANTFGELREDILRLAQVLVQDVQALLVASTGTRTELTSTASVAHENIGQLVETIRAGAASLGSNNKETQVMLLTTAKRAMCGLSNVLPPHQHHTTTAHSATRHANACRGWAYAAMPHQPSW